MREAIAFHASRAAEKLRAQGSAASGIHVFITTNRFKEGERQYASTSSIELPVASAYTPDIIAYALQVLEKIYKPGYRYHKAGVMLTEIVPEENVQLDMFTTRRTQPKHHSLMETLDRLNRRWGKKTVRYAAEGTRYGWQMRQWRLTPRFTTLWSDLPVVKASF